MEPGRQETSAFLAVNFLPPPPKKFKSYSLPPPFPITRAKEEQKTEVSRLCGNDLFPFPLLLHSENGTLEAKAAANHFLPASISEWGKRGESEKKALPKNTSFFLTHFLFFSYLALMTLCVLGWWQFTLQVVLPRGLHTEIEKRPKLALIMRITVPEIIWENDSCF